ncbi:MAG: hypothetical protein ACRCT8_10910 [Lacipirellulaceae bacterium]
MQPAPNPDETAESRPRRVFGLGTDLNWDSEQVEVALAVELPFRLLMPSGRIAVRYEGALVNVHIENHGVEIQRGTQYSATHRNTLFIGSWEAAQTALMPTIGITGGGVFRGTKTLLYMSAFPIEDACYALFGPNSPRYQSGYRYFATLANGHIPIVNEVINAYRRVSIDPFAREITKWDVPNWFVVAPPRDSAFAPDTAVVCLYGGIVNDWYPTIREGLEGEESPLYTATAEDVTRTLGENSTPGELDLLDGWSLFHSGRFADSIRSFVTAIEVLVESEVKRILSDRGVNAVEIKRQLDATRANFDSRLELYCTLTDLRLPGPRLCGMPPYFNGFKLHDEIRRTRRLRHQIVHHGHRLDDSFRGPMLRAAETTSWLFDWIAPQSRFEERRGPMHAVYFGMRVHDTPFEYGVVDGHVLVLKPSILDSNVDPLADRDPSDPGPVVIDDPLRVVHSSHILWNALGAKDGGRDIEHFVRMALYELGLGEVDDSPYQTSLKNPQERYTFTYEGLRTAVYCVDQTATFGETECAILAARVAEQAKIGRVFDRVLVVLNDYVRSRRTKALPLPARVEQCARELGLRVVSASELAMLVLGVLDYGWNHLQILSDLIGADGVHACTPPSSELIGTTYRMWVRKSIVGVQLRSGIAVSASAKIAIALRRCYSEIVLGEHRIDVGGRLTFACDIDATEFRSGAAVFLLDAVRSYSNLERYERPSDGPIEKMFAARAVHPSESAN